MKNYAILHARRIKTGGHARLLERHCKREVPAAQLERWQVNPNKAPLNVVIGESIVEGRKKMMDEIGEKWTRKPQKNAAYCVEFVITSSQDVGVEYLKKSLDWLNKTYEVIFAAVHFDETTPHIHAYVLPVTYDEDRQAWAYSTDKILGNKRDLRKLQDKFWEEVGKNFGLDRGESTERKREMGIAVHHTGLSQFNSRGQFETKKKELEQWEKDLKIAWAALTEVQKGQVVQKIKEKNANAERKRGGMEL